MSTMLQALGSSTNAKIAYVMFGGCCVLIIGAFVFVAKYERITMDDTYAYCATAYYSPKTWYNIEYWKQRNDFDKIDTGCARACYKHQKSTHGLSYLEIETQSGYNDYNQAYAAGMLEGSLTWMSIYAQWKNTIDSFCTKNEESAKFCAWLRSIIDRNHKNIITIAKQKRQNSSYHHQIYLFYQQLYGIERGFKQGYKRARQEPKDFEIPFEDFLLLNARVDIEDLKVYYQKFVVENEEDSIETYESVGKMILKFINSDSSHILVGHSSDGEYNSMLKIVKTYRFNYHQNPEVHLKKHHHLVTNTDITFTSYPGAIASTDDFYLANGKHSRIIVTGVKMKYNNEVQVHGIDLDSAVLMSVRVMAATRLAHNGKSWARFMAKDPDIGAKQWLVIDEKRLKYLKLNNANDEEFVTSSSTHNDGIIMDNEIPLEHVIIERENVMSTTSDVINNQNIIWLIDNTWKRLHGEDVTARFKKDDAWICDGTPYFKVIQDLNLIDGKDLKLEQPIDNLDNLASALRLRAHRGDLKELADEMFPYGNTDIKLYTSKEHQFSVQSGPVSTSTDDEESIAFDWTRFDDVSHDEHPEIWNFPLVEVQYFWN